MPTFTYTARAVNGELQTATIDAPNRDEVIAQLRQAAAERRQDRRGHARRRRSARARSRCATS